MTDTEKHWLLRPGTLRWLRVGFGAALVLTLLAELVVARHPHFAVEGVFGFYAWYGFGTAAVTVLLAKAVGWLLKRKDMYYGD